MLAKLGSSSPIDREGSGETPDACSNFVRVDPIPRCPARQASYGLERFGRSFHYEGGAPRCPRCLTSRHVKFNGRGFRYCREASSGFHCNRCRVWWSDSDEAMCFICEAVFKCEPDKHPSMFSGGRSYVKAHGSCYHLNSIREPFCAKCAATIGPDRAHCRRELRRRAGLR